MNRLLLAIVIALLAGLAVGALLTGPERPLSTMDEPPDDGGLAILEERVESLEQMLLDERFERQLLEEQLQTLVGDAATAERDTARRGPRGEQGDVAATHSNVVEPARRRQRDFGAMIRNYEQRRRDDLVNNGFSEDEADRLLELESRAQYDAMLANYEAQRSGKPLSDNLGSAQAIVRERLGDEEYERYLIAQGQPTAVQVLTVLKGSPGSSAGLLPGDEIIRYNGQRTFNMNDLRDLTYAGEQGDTVVVDITRDGVPMQLSLPIGPIGMNGSGASVRIRRNGGGG